MGAGASLSAEGHLYQINDCGCVYACYYEKQTAVAVELRKCCYTHLEKLKHREYDVAAYRRMEKRTVGLPISDLSDGWMTPAETIQEATRRGVRGIDEFVDNRNVLERFGIYPLSIYK